MISSPSDAMDRMGLITILFSVLVSFSSISTNADNFDVVHFGAFSNNVGKDSSRAFAKAWNAACSSTAKSPTVVVPARNEFLVHPVNFTGPCKSNNITFQILGRIVAPGSPRAWDGLAKGKWMTFSRVNGLKVTGPGTIDGFGGGWWSHSCRDHPGLIGCTSLAPTAVNLMSCNGTSFTNIFSKNPPQVHLLIYGCNRITVDNVKMIAPGLSPNTDGIHIQSSHSITIKNSYISTGDDCVSIGDYTSDVNVTDVKCGPGHGISIGSLGGGGNVVQVENIHVNRVNLSRSTNGARIKTYSVGKGSVRGVKFENINFDSVENPIIIDQYYGQQKGAGQPTQTGVHISDVLFNNLQGTSSTEVGILLNCSNVVACTGITLQDIRITSNITGKPVTSVCTNAHGNSLGTVQPKPCLIS